MFNDVVWPGIHRVHGIEGQPRVIAGPDGRWVDVDYAAAVAKNNGHPVEFRTDALGTFLWIGDAPRRCPHCGK